MCIQQFSDGSLRRGTLRVARIVIGENPSGSRSGAIAIPQDRQNRIKRCGVRARQLDYLHVMIWLLVAALAVAGLAGLLSIVVLAAYGGMDTTASRDLSKRKAVADDAGNLHVPDTYRTTYELLGSWAEAADQGQGSKQLHVVYASPGTIAAYRTDGRFPDGAVLVKEVFKAATGQMTTGTVSHAETLKGCSS